MGPYSILVRCMLSRFSPYHAYHNHLATLLLPSPITKLLEGQAKLPNLARPVGYVPPSQRDAPHFMIGQMRCIIHLVTTCTTVIIL